MNKQLCLPAPAKINLFLHILGRRLDGYHDLQSVMQFVDFSDRLTFTLSHDDAMTLDSNFSTPDNLVLRAATLLQQYAAVDVGVKICLDKKLPAGAGMGGGSSDAATTLLGLNRLWGLQLDIDTLAELGQKLGADVPFFVRGHAGWVESTGEQITPMVLPERWYLLLMPKCTISTAALFASQELKRDCTRLEMQDYQYGFGDNVFEPVVCSRYPEVNEALSWLSQYTDAKMTGTGATVFGIFDTEIEAGRIAALVPSHLRSHVAQGLNKSPLWSSLS